MYIGVCGLHVNAWCSTRLQRVSDLLKLELQKVVSCPEGVGNTWVHLDPLQEQLSPLSHQAIYSVPRHTEF